MTISFLFEIYNHYIGFTQFWKAASAKVYSNAAETNSRVRFAIRIPMKYSVGACKQIRCLICFKDFLFWQQLHLFRCGFLRLNSTKNFSNTLKKRVSEGSRFLAIGDYRSLGPVNLDVFFLFQLRNASI